MIKWTSFVLGLLLMLGACASPAGVETAGEETASAETPSGTTAVPVAPTATEPASTAPSEASTDTAAPAAPMTPVPDGPLAPDFTLALGDGRSFTLSEESKPVYMVFWAEW